MADLKPGVARSRESVVPLTNGPALVGGTAFGFGDANGHKVSGEHRMVGGWPAPEEEILTPMFLPLSADSESVLRKIAAEVATLVEDGNASLRDIAATAALLCTHHSRRLLVRADSPDRAAQALRRFAEGESDPLLIHGTSLGLHPKVVFVFAGNGAQGTEEGLRLMIQDPALAPAVRRADALVKAACGWSIIEQINLPPDARKISSAELVQPLSFAIQAALVEAMAAQGLHPDAVTGHSFGEIPAAWAAGALSFEQAIHLILERNAALKLSRGKGGMAAASIDAARAEREIDRYRGAVEIAAVNSPFAVTFTGDPDCLDDLGRLLIADGVNFRSLELDYPFHSRRLDVARESFVKALAGLEPSSSRYPFYSTVLGSSMPGELLNAEYWWRNMRQCVRFDLAMAAMIADGHSIFVEIGAHPIMQAYVRHALRAAHARGQVLSLVSQQAAHGAARRIGTAVAKAYTLGARLDWKLRYPGEGRLASFPACPCEREIFSAPPTADARHGGGSCGEGASRGDEASKGNGDLLLLAANMSDDEVMELTLDVLKERVGEVLRISPGKLDIHRPVTELGMDSLSATELRLLIESKFGFDLPVVIISEGASIARLARRICDFLRSSPTERPANDRLAEFHAKHGPSIIPLSNGATAGSSVTTAESGINHGHE